jgi:tetratricopeptide (TPR) repeat protein
VLATESAIVFEPIEPLDLKGKAAPMAAWRVVRVASGTADLVAPPFVGRLDELRRLKELLHATGREQRLRLVSIIGPAGIGKTRLVEELGEYADGITEPIYWHAGRSPSYGEGLAFWPLGEMVRRRAGLAEGDDEQVTRERIAATVDEYVDDADERAWITAALLALLGIGESGQGETLFPAWRTFLERIATRGPVVLVFEDLQWADAGTLEFIEHLLDWSRAQPILVLTLARPELLDERPGWGSSRSSATAMPLAPLPDEDMRALVGAMLPQLPEPQLDAIVNRAEGMPLYAVEMIRALLGAERIRPAGAAFELTGAIDELPIPASLRSLIGSRLDALDPEDRGLMQDASVLGLAFGADALASVSGRSEAELEPRLRGLVRRELLQIDADPRSPERGQYRYVQSLIREVAYDTLALRERRTRHLAAARHLEAGESDETAGALASHYLAAYHASDEGPEADAVASQARVSLRAAAERAASLGAHQQAVRNLEHALEITTQPTERAALLERAAASAMAGALAEAPPLALEAVQTWQTVGDREGIARATALHADALTDVGEVGSAAAVLKDAVDAIEASVPADQWGEAEARLFAMRSRVLMRNDANEEALLEADRALRIAEHGNHDVVAAMAIVNKGSALAQLGRRRESEALLEAGARFAGRLALPHLELRALRNLGVIASDDEPLRALEIMLDAIESARRAGDQNAFASLVSVYGEVAFQTGSTEVGDRVVGLMDEASELPIAAVDQSGMAAYRIADAIRQGKDVADELVAAGQLAERDPDPRSAELANILLADAELVAGRPREAIAVGRAAMERAVDGGTYSESTIVTAAILAADLEALAWLDAKNDGVPFHGASSEAIRAQVRAARAAVEGRSADSIAAFTDAERGFEAVGLLYLWARCILDALLAMPGEPLFAARAPEARAVFERIGATPFIALLDNAVTRAAARPAEPSAAVPSASEVS